MKTDLVQDEQRKISCHPGSELRCHCGNMMGQITPRGIEVKCRRCKRIHVIPLAILEQFHHPSKAAAR